jgi:hypothetical protein
MNDDDLKKLFKSAKYQQPSPLEMARWKKVVRSEVLNRTPGEWTRLAVACLVGVLIGAAAFKSPVSKEHEENFSDDATIERVYVNL